jgi:hypothetical protein
MQSSYPEEDCAFDNYIMEILLLDEEEEEEAEEEDMRTRLAAALLLMGAEADCEVHLECRRSHRAYLTRPELMANPRVLSPWQSLYRSQSDRAFITTMGLDTATFNHILFTGFQYEWDNTSIPRPDTSASGQVRLDARSLDAPGALGLVLHYLNSTMRELSLQQIFSLIPTTVNRYLHFGLDILQEVLHKIPAACIKWPTSSQMSEYAEIISIRHPKLGIMSEGVFCGAFGSIDGLNVPMATADDAEVENATYNGWLHAHVCSNVLVFSPKGMYYIKT